MNVNLKKAFGTAAARATLINPWGVSNKPNAVRGGEVANELGLVLAGLDDTAGLAEASNLIRASVTDKDKLAELNAIRLKTTQNYIFSTANFLSTFFMVESLADNERPAVQNETKQEVIIGYVGQEGRPGRIKVAPDTKETLIDLRILASATVNYEIQDIYNGNVEKSATKTIDIAYDLANQIDKEVFTLMSADPANGGAFGNFTTTGKKSARTFLPNSRILTANLPTSNTITVTGTSGSTKFRWAVLDAIGRYASQWAGAFPDGPMKPTGVVIVPALDIWDLTEGIAPTGSMQNKISEQLLADGPTVQFHYMGINWKLIPDNTIASGTCYAQYNRPLGTVWAKPSQDMEVEERFPKRNLVERYQTRVYGASIFGPDRIFATKLIYKS